MATILFPVNELKIGGAEQQLLELVRGLDKDRFHPIVAPLYPGGALESEFLAVPGIEVVNLGRRGKYDFTPLTRVAGLLRERHVDIVQPFLSPATLFGLTPALLMRTPVKIVTERCGVRRTRGLGYRMYRAVEDQLTHFADAVVPNSDAGKEDLIRRRIACGKIKVIHNGINLDRLQVSWTNVAAHRALLGVPEDGLVVGILANLIPAKGHDTLLHAAARLRDLRSDSKLRYAVIGDGPLRGSLESLAAQLGLRNEVRFLGHQRSVADYLGACDLLVSASRDNEGTSNSILEAMALGVPVVATDVGGNRELVEDGETGYLVPADNAELLASTLASALDDPVSREAIAARARQMVSSRYSLRRMVASYEDLYASLLSRQTELARSPVASERSVLG